jgi:hypothetical protein
MTRPPPRNVAASIRDRLRNHARATGQDFQRVLTRYGIERFLYRLAKSRIRERFVLKGAMLLATWADTPFRATGDLDLLGFGDPGVETARSAFAHLCGLQTDVDDGLVFVQETIMVERTREDEEYKGLHVRLDARLDTTVIAILIDIGFGDVIHPAAIEVDYPRLLTDLPAANIRAYPAATVIAEKFDTMVRFGDFASRLKDHFDIWAISRTFDFDTAALAAAIGLTLANRERELPEEWPASLTDEFAVDPATARQWGAFLRRTAPALTPPPFPELVIELRTFLDPVLDRVRDSAVPNRLWSPTTGWTT